MRSSLFEPPSTAQDVDLYQQIPTLLRKDTDIDTYRHISPDIDNIHHHTTDYLPLLEQGGGGLGGGACTSGIGECSSSSRGGEGGQEGGGGGGSRSGGGGGVDLVGHVSLVEEAGEASGRENKAEPQEVLSLRALLLSLLTLLLSFLACFTLLVQKTYKY
jgi:hypothetical protein